MFGGGGLKTETIFATFSKLPSQGIDVGPFMVFPTTFLMFTIATTFLLCHLEHSWWPKLKKEAMAASIGMQWRHGATILTRFKLLNIISV